MPIYEYNGKRYNIPEAKAQELVARMPGAKLVNEAPYYLADKPSPQPPTGEQIDVNVPQVNPSTFDSEMVRQTQAKQLGGGVTIGQKQNIADVTGDMYGNRELTLPVPKNAAQEQDGFWSTMAGDFGEKIGAGALNLAGGLAKVHENTNPIMLAARKLLGKDGDMVPDAIPQQLLATGKEVSERGDRYGLVVDPETGEARKKTYSDLWKEGKRGSAAMEAMLTATESLPTSAMAMVPGAGLTLIGLSVAGQTYNELDNNPETKDLPEWKKILNASASGAIEGLTERLGAKVDMKVFEPVLKKMGEQTVKGILKKGGIGALIQTITEGGEEVISQLGGNVVDYATGVSDEYKPFEGVKDSFVYGAAGGAQFGGVTGAGTIFRAVEQHKANVENAKVQNTLRLWESISKKQSQALPALNNEKQQLEAELGDLTALSFEEVANSTEATPELIESRRRYDIVNAEYEGVMENLKREVDDFIAPQVQAIQDVAKDGVITELNVGTEDAPDIVYLVKGDVAINEDGTIDPAATSPMLTVKNSEGKKRMIARSKIATAQQDDLNTTIHGIQQRAYEKLVRPVADKMEGKTHFQNGEKVEYTNSKGETVAGTVTAKQNNTVTVVGIDGKKTETFTEDELAQRLVGETIDDVRTRDVIQVQMNGQVYDADVTNIQDGIAELHIPSFPEAAGRYQDVTAAELRRMRVMPQAQVQVDSKTTQETAENEGLPAGEIRQNASETAETAAESKITPEQQQEQFIASLPKTKEGDIDYTQIEDDDTFITALKSEFPEDAAEIVEEYRKQAEKKLKDAGKVQDPVRKKRAQRAAQAQVDRFSNMYERLNPRSKYQARADELDNGSIRERESKMGEYVSLRDYLLRNIATGKFKFRWNDSGTNKGLAGEILATKNTESERKIRLPYLDNNGYSPESLAEHIYESAGQGSEVNPGWFKDDSDIRNEIIDVLQTFDKPTRMIDAAAELHKQPESLEEYYENLVDPAEIFNYEANEESQNDMLRSLPTQELHNQISDQEVELYFTDNNSTFDTTNSQQYDNQNEGTRAGSDRADAKQSGARTDQGDNSRNDGGREDQAIGDLPFAGEAGGTGERSAPASIEQPATEGARQEPGRLAKGSTEGVKQITPSENVAQNENINNFVTNDQQDEKPGETRLDNRPAVEGGTIGRVVGGQPQTVGINRTIQASNSAGSVRADYTPAELEELESRGIDPYWDKPTFHRALKAEAQKNGVWLDNSYLSDKSLLHDQKSSGTSENDMYLNSDGETVTKVNNLSYVKGTDHHNNLNSFIDRINTHNALFPDLAYTIIGFMENKNGFPAMVLEQPFISDVEGNATQEEINDYLTSRGFKLDGTRRWSNEHQVWTNGVHELFDARPANVLKGNDGQLYFIDTFPHSVEYMTQPDVDGSTSTNPPQSSPKQTTSVENNQQEFSSDGVEQPVNQTNDKQVDSPLSDQKENIDQQEVYKINAEETEKINKIFASVSHLAPHNEQLWAKTSISRWQANKFLKDIREFQDAAVENGTIEYKEHLDRHYYEIVDGKEIKINTYKLNGYTVEIGYEGGFSTHGASGLYTQVENPQGEILKIYDPKYRTEKTNDISYQHPRFREKQAGPKEIDVEGLFGALRTKGEAKLSDHVKPQEDEKPAYGANNKIITQERYNELREQMRKKLNNLNVGFDPEVFSIGAQMAMFHIESGAHKFADFAKRMVDDLGDAIRPYLKASYEGARAMPGMEELSSRMDPYKDVVAFDVNQSFEEQQEGSQQKQFTFKQETPMSYGKAMKIMEKRYRYPDGKVMTRYEWIESLPHGLEVRTVKVAAKNDEGYREELWLNQTTITKTEQDYYEYLQQGGMTISDYLAEEEKKAIEEEKKLIEEKKAKEEEKRKQNEIAQAKQDKIRQDTMVSALQSTREEFIEIGTKNERDYVESFNNRRRKDSAYERELAVAKNNLEARKASAGKFYDMANAVYSMDETGNPVRKYNYKVGDKVVVTAWANPVETVIQEVKGEGENAMYVVEKRDGIHNQYVHYDLMRPVEKDTITKEQYESFDTRGYTYAVVKDGKVVTRGSNPILAKEPMPIKSLLDIADNLNGDLYIAPTSGQPIDTRSTDDLIMGLTWQQILDKQQGKNINLANELKMPENAVLFPKYEQLYQNDLVENDVPLDSQPIDIAQKAKEAVERDRERRETREESNVNGETKESVEKDKAIDPDVKPKKGDKIAFEIGGREVKFDYDSFISDNNGTLTYDYFGMKTLKPGEYMIERGNEVVNYKADNYNTVSAPVEKIDDFGEKIEGAKKDTWKPNKATEESIQTQPLSKTFPRPDFMKLVNDGHVSVDGALILKYLYEEIPSKPRKKHKLNSWVRKVKDAIDVMNQFVDNPSSVDEYMVMLNGMPDYFKDKILLYIKVQKLLGFPSEDINTGKYEIKQFHNSDGYSIVNAPYILGKYKTLEEAVDALKKGLQANKASQNKDEVKLYLYQDRETKKYFIGKKGATGIVRLMDGIETIEEARRTYKEQQPQLQEMWRALKVKPEERRERNRDRIGTDYRKGKNVKPELFSETFGFRGVQFGNWVNSQERQDALNDAYDALMDLSTALGISTRAISLNGELGLAFGARGSGKANAHYEPGQIVINLTKTKGAGSLAHEWWHALDNYFSRSRGESSSYLTEKPRQGRSMTGQMDERIRKEMIDAFKNLTTVINKSGISKRSKELDKTRSKAYWSTIVEMSARAFENFIIEKMAQTNESNDYLANFKELSEWTDQSSLDVGSYPYPTKEETETINAAYQELFDTIQEKVDEETGNTILFRKVDDSGFYSTVEDALEKIKQEKGTPEQFKAMLLKNGAKQAELDWMGWDERFPDGKQTISKTEVQDWIDQNRIEVKEVEKGNPKIKWEEKDGIYTLGNYVVEKNIHGDWAVTEKGEGWHGDYSTLDGAKNFAESNTKGYTNTKFSEYTLPGGKNYKELLLTMPYTASINREEVSNRVDSINAELEELRGKGHSAERISELLNERDRLITELNNEAKSGFKSSHFDEPNILAHVRFNERTVNGERVLFLEEIQSDWAQEGKKKGFNNISPIKINNGWRVSGGEIGMDAIEDKDGWYTVEHGSGNIVGYDTEIDAKQALIDYAASKRINAVPDMPFKKTDQWVNLALRRMMMYAAENGYDRIAWTTGQQQADRYDLSKQVDWIEYGKNENGTYWFALPVEYSKPSELTEQELESYVGKDIAKKMIDGEGVDGELGGKRLQGNDLKVGGSGMIAFYDRIVPKAAKKLSKPFGANVETVEIPEIGQQQSIPVTDALREIAPNGMPLFNQGEKMAQLDERLKSVIKRGIKTETVRQIIDEIESAHTSEIEATVVNNKQELIDLLRMMNTNEEMVAEAEDPDVPLKGVYFRGMIFINAGEMNSVDDVLKVWVHENFHAWMKKDPSKIVPLMGVFSEETLNSNLYKGYHKQSEAVKIEEIIAFAVEKVYVGGPLTSKREIRDHLDPIIKQYLDYATEGEFSKRNPDFGRGRGRNADALLDNEGSGREGVAATRKGGSPYQQRQANEAILPGDERVPGEEVKRADDLFDNIDNLKSVVKDYGGFLGKVFEGAPNRGDMLAYARENGFDKLGEGIEQYLADVEDPAELSRIKELLGVDMPDNALRYMLWRNANPNENTVVWKAKEAVKRNELDENILFRKGEVPSSIKNDKYEQRIRSRHNRGFRSLMYGIEEGWFDRMASLRILQNAITGGKAVSDKANAYMLENQLTSRNTADIRYYTKNLVDPFVKQIHDIFGRNMNAADEYMNAKHGLERNDLMAEEEAKRKYAKNIASLNKEYADEKIDEDTYNEKMEAINGKIEAYAEKLKEEKDYSGLTAIAAERGREDFKAVAQEIVAEIEGGVPKEDIDALWSRVNSATKWILDKQYNAGIMTKDIYDKIRGMYKYYVPLRGFEEVTATDLYEYIDNSPSNFEGTVKKAYGRTSKAESPTATIMSMGESGIMQANRNRMKQAFYRLVATNPSNYASIEDVWFVETADGFEERFPDISPTASADEVLEAIADFNNDMAELAAEGKAFQGRNKLDIGVKIMKAQASEHVIRVWIAGEEKVIFINGNPRAAQAINGLVQKDLLNKDNLRHGVHYWSRQMAANFTSRNPAFMVTNLMRDVQFAVVSAAVKEGIPYSSRLAKNVFLVGKTISANVFKDGNKDNAEFQKYWEEFEANGGETGYANLHSIDFNRKYVNKKLREFSDQRDFLKPFRAYVQFMENGNRTIEDMSRFATYVTSRQIGRSIERSVSDAKEITINFNRKGSGGFGANLIHSFYLFSNPALQSMRLMGMLAKNHPVKFTAMLSSAMGAGFMVPMINELLLELFGDDDDKEKYQNITPWVRRNNLVLYAPGTKGKFITLMLPHELRAFYGIGEMAYEKANGGLRRENMVVETAKQMTAMLPIDPMGGPDWWVPDALKPPYQAYVTNRNFMDRPIYRKSIWNEHDPEWTKAYKGTPELLVEAAKGASDITGGDDVVPGWANANPARVYHLFSGYMGGFMTTYTDMSMIAFNLLTGRDVRANDMPVVNKLIRTSDEKTEELRINSEYFYYIDWIREYEHRTKGYEKRVQDPEYRDKYMDVMRDKEQRMYNFAKGQIALIDQLKDYDEEKANEMKEQFVRKMWEYEDQD